MAYDVNGNFTRVYNFQVDRDGGIKIRADRVDGECDGFATAFNLAFLRDGRVAMTGNLKMGANRVTGISAGTVGSPAMNFTADATTGMYSPAAGIVAVSLLGVEAARFVTGGMQLSTTKAMGTNTLDVATTAFVIAEVKQTMFSAYLAGAATAIVNNTPTQIVCPTVEFDDKAEYNSGTGVFTAAKAGYYQFTYSTYLTDAGSAINVNHTFLKKNATYFLNGTSSADNQMASQAYPTASIDATTAGTFVCKLAAGDTVSLWVRTVATSSTLKAAFFQGVWLRGI